MDNLELQVKAPLINELVDTCEFLKEVIESPSTYYKKDLNKWDEISQILNKIFPNKKCLRTVITYNTDKLFFGVIVNPVIDNKTMTTIITTSDELSIDSYMLEIDSKAISVLDADDLAMYILHDIDAITSPVAITKLRAFMDIILANDEKTFNIKNSINYSNILIYGMKYSLRQLTNLTHMTDDELKSWPRLNIIRETISNVSPGLMVDTSEPNMSLLKWCLIIYNSISTEYLDAIDTLTNAKKLTGSQLEKTEISNLIDSLGKASNELISESGLFEAFDNKNTKQIIREQYLTEKGFSLFNNLKKNGLRSIEDDLYEYKVRIRNCSDQEDAIYILRCINTRLSILDDYLSNEEITDFERQRWQDVADKFRELRIEIGNKKFTSPVKQYNDFLNIDYNALDKLDRPASN